MAKFTGKKSSFFKHLTDDLLVEHFKRPDELIQKGYTEEDWQALTRELKNRKIRKRPGAMDRYYREKQHEKARPHLYERGFKGKRERKI